MRTKNAVLTEAEIAFVRSLVIFQDEHILALAKPAGISSQGGHRGVNSLDELLGAFVKASGSRPRLVHRLDRDTSGVLLTARTAPAAAFLGKAMMGRKVRKTYLAIAAPPKLEPREGMIDAPLRRVEAGRESFVEVVDIEAPGAQEALTRYRVLAANAEAALVELNPRTGRMHQLRVHLASRGAPIAGDPRYGGALALAGGSAPRLMLHAAALAFPHPGGGTLRIEAPVPADFREVIGRLGLALPERWNAEGPLVLDAQGTRLETVACDLESSPPAP